MNGRMLSMRHDTATGRENSRRQNGFFARGRGKGKISSITFISDAAGTASVSFAPVYGYIAGVLSFSLLLTGRKPNISRVTEG